MPMEPSLLPECCRQLSVCTCCMVNMHYVVSQEVILKGVPWDRVTWGMPLLGVLQRLRKLVLTDNHLSNLHQVSNGCCHGLHLCVHFCRGFMKKHVSKQCQQQEVVAGSQVPSHYQAVCRDCSHTTRCLHNHYSTALCSLMQMLHIALYCKS